MSFTAKIIEIFISSPTDVLSERETIGQIASQWNASRGKNCGCFISILTWESIVTPGISDRSQNVINDQIGDTYDIYLGLFWHRFGTPTGISSSGTEEELNRAIARLKEGAKPKICLLFKKGTVDIDKVDPIQLSSVKKLKSEASDLGIFYREFSDESSLRSVLTLIFEEAARDEQDVTHINNSTAENIRSDLPKIQMTTIEIDDDVGLMDNAEEFEKTVSVLMTILAEIGQQENYNTEILTKGTEKLAILGQLGSLNKASIKPIIDDVVSSFNRYSDYLEKSVPDVEHNCYHIARLLDIDLRIKGEISGPDNTIGEVKVLSGILEETIANLDHISSSTEALPRLSTAMTKARNRLSKLRRRLQDSFVSLKQSIDNILKLYE